MSIFNITFLFLNSEWVVFFLKKLVLLPPFALFVAYAKCSQQLCVGFKK